MTPGEYIKTLRKKNKISQDELARKLNFERSTIAKYENNTNQMKYEVIKAFSVFFNEPIINIINGDSSACNNLTEDNDKYLIEYYNYKIENNNLKNRYRTIKIIFLFALVLIIMLCSIISINKKYKDIDSYILCIDNKNINSDILIIDTIENFYLNINNISVQNDKIISLTLYYIENNEKYFIYQTYNDNISNLLLSDNIYEQKYFNFDKKKIIINNLHFIIRTNSNQTYDLNTRLYKNVEKKTNKNIIKKTNYKLDEKYNNNIYNINTIVEYNKCKYIVKSEKDIINVSSSSNNTNIKINNNIIMGKYNNKDILINSLNIKENDLNIYNEIHDIIYNALDNMTSN